MNKKGITISGALELLNSGATVTLQVITCDINRGTGGRRIILQNAKRIGSRHSTKETGTITVQEMHRRDYPVTIHTSLIEKINGINVL